MGIGNANFSAMEQLDADKQTLTLYGKYAARDIVQFVPLNSYHDLDPNIAYLQLAKDVLAEVPKQFMDYMKLNGIVPKKRASQTNTPEIENLKIQ